LEWLLGGSSDDDRWQLRAEYGALVLVHEEETLMTSPYDLFEATREAVDKFMAEDRESEEAERPRCLGCGSRGCEDPNCVPLESQE
jgi:hypothetical protein